MKKLTITSIFLLFLIGLGFAYPPICNGYICNGGFETQGIGYLPNASTYFWTPLCSDIAFTYAGQGLNNSYAVVGSNLTATNCDPVINSSIFEIGQFIKFLDNNGTISFYGKINPNNELNVSTMWLSLGDCAPLSTKYYTQIYQLPKTDYQKFTFYFNETMSNPISNLKDKTAVALCLLHPQQNITTGELGVYFDNFALSYETAKPQTQAEKDFLNLIYGDHGSALYNYTTSFSPFSVIDTQRGKALNTSDWYAWTMTIEEPTGAQSVEFSAVTTYTFVASYFYHRYYDGSTGSWSLWERFSTDSFSDCIGNLTPVTRLQFAGLTPVNQTGINFIHQFNLRSWNAVNCAGSSSTDNIDFRLNTPDVENVVMPNIQLLKNNFVGILNAWDNKFRLYSLNAFDNSTARTIDVFRNGAFINSISAPNIIYPNEYEDIDYSADADLGDSVKFIENTKEIYNRSETIYIYGDNAEYCQTYCDGLTLYEVLNATTCEFTIVPNSTACLSQLAITGLQVTDRQVNSISLSWDAVINKDIYFVDSHETINRTADVRGFGVTNESVTISDLKADTSYTFNVQACVSGGADVYCGNKAQIIAKTLAVGEDLTDTENQILAFLLQYMSRSTLILLGLIVSLVVAVITAHYTKHFQMGILSFLIMLLILGFVGLLPAIISVTAVVIVILAFSLWFLLKTFGVSS